MSNLSYYSTMDLNKHKNKLSQFMEIKDEEIDNKEKIVAVPVLKEDKVKQWEDLCIDEFKCKLVLCKMEKTFEETVDKYTRNLEKELDNFTKKNMLKMRILKHLEFFRLVLRLLSKQIFSCCPNNYLDNVERLLVIFCNIEIKAVNYWRKHNNNNVLPSRVAQKLINALFINLLSDRKRIFHVLLKLYLPQEIECKDIMSLVYKHFLTNIPVEDYTDISHFRYYLLFEKWKCFIEEKDYPQLDSMFHLLFSPFTEKIQNKTVFREIGAFPLNNSIRFLGSMTPGPTLLVRKYFNYINKVCVERDSTIPQIIIDSDEEDAKVFEYYDKRRNPLRSFVKTELQEQKCGKKHLDRNKPIYVEDDDDSDVEIVAVKTDKSIKPLNWQNQLSFPSCVTTARKSVSVAPTLQENEERLPLPSNLLENELASSNLPEKPGLEEVVITDNCDSDIDSNKNDNATKGSQCDASVVQVESTDNNIEAGTLTENEKSTTPTDLGPSAEYFCGMDTPPSDRTGDESGPTTLDIISNDTNVTEESFIETSYEMHDLEINIPTPLRSSGSDKDYTEIADYAESLDKSHKLIIENVSSLNSSVMEINHIKELDMSGSIDQDLNNIEITEAQINDQEAFMDIHVDETNFQDLENELSEYVVVDDSCFNVESANTKTNKKSDCDDLSDKSLSNAKDNNELQTVGVSVIVNKSSENEKNPQRDEFHCYINDQLTNLTELSSVNAASIMQVNSSMNKKSVLARENSFNQDSFSMVNTSLPQSVPDGSLFLNKSLTTQKPSQSATISSSKYMYSPMKQNVDVGKNMLLSSIMSSPLSEFETFHQKPNTYAMTSRDVNASPSHKVLASVTMPSLIDDIRPPTNRTSGRKPKQSKRSINYDRIYHMEDEQSHRIMCDKFDQFQQSQLNITAPLNPAGLSENSYFDLYKAKNMQTQNDAERNSPVSPAYENIQAQDYKNHMMKVNQANSFSKGKSLSGLQDLAIGHELNQIKNSSKYKLNNSGNSDLSVLYSNLVPSRGGLKRKHNERNKKVTFNNRIQTYSIPSKEIQSESESSVKSDAESVVLTKINNYPLLMSGAGLEANALSVSASKPSRVRSNKRRTSDYSRYNNTLPVKPTKVPSLTICDDSFATCNILKNDKKLICKPCVELKMDNKEELDRKQQKESLKFKLNFAMNKKGLVTENTCIQTRIDFIKSDETNLLSGSRAIESRVSYPDYSSFPYQEANYFNYSNGGYANPVYAVKPEEENTAALNLTIPPKSNSPNVSCPESEFSNSPKLIHNSEQIVENCLRQCNEPINVDYAKYNSNLLSNNSNFCSPPSHFCSTTMSSNGSDKHKPLKKRKMGYPSTPALGIAEVLEEVKRMSSKSNSKPLPNTTADINHNIGKVVYNNAIINYHFAPIIGVISETGEDAAKQEQSKQTNTDCYYNENCSCLERNKHSKDSIADFWNGNDSLLARNSIGRRDKVNCTIPDTSKGRGRRKEVTTLFMPEMPRKRGRPRKIDALIPRSTTNPMVSYLNRSFRYV